MNFFQFVFRLFLAIAYLVIATPLFCGIFVLLVSFACTVTVGGIAVGFVGVICYGAYQIIKSQFKRFAAKLVF